MTEKRKKLTPDQEAQITEFFKFIFEPCDLCHAKDVKTKWLGMHRLCNACWPKVADARVKYEERNLPK